MVLYATLPVWFKVPTPLGSYTPDLALGSGLWAVLLASATKRLYFVLWGAKAASWAKTYVGRSAPRPSAGRALPGPGDWCGSCVVVP